MDARAIQLDEATLAKAQDLAASRRCSIEELLRELVAEQTLVSAEPVSDLTGFLVDEPEVADQIMEDVYRTREAQTLRTPANGSSD